MLANHSDQEARHRAAQAAHGFYLTQAARQTAESTWGGWEGAIDPNTVIIQDMWIYGSSSAGSVINYMIEIERVTLSDDQAILSLIQERGEDDL